MSKKKITGRGRPKGSINKMESSQVVQASESVQSSGRRGRPKGSKNKANIEQPQPQAKAENVQLVGFGVQEIPLTLKVTLEPKVTSQTKTVLRRKKSPEAEA